MKIDGTKQRPARGRILINAASSILILAVIFATSIACHGLERGSHRAATGGSLPEGASSGDRGLALTNVKVIPMTTNMVMRKQTVVVKDGRISAIFPARDGSPPAGARIIDGGGGYLLPGLADMHVHLSGLERRD
jgi:hypothetical protein